MEQSASKTKLRKEDKRGRPQIRHVRRIEALGIVVLVSLFTASFFFTTFLIENLANNALTAVFPEVEWVTNQNEIIASLRPFGYIAFFMTMILILVGLILKKAALTTASSFALFLPTFGYFALTMFMLAGIGVLRTIWLPLFDLSSFAFGSLSLSPGYVNVLNLGQIVFLPFLASGSFLGSVLAKSLMVLGLFIFFLGTFTWLYGKYRGSAVIDFWIYKLSRHPQYLGYLLWSYGTLIYVSLLHTAKGGYVPEPSFPWLLSAMIVVGVAFYEEKITFKKYGERYSSYRDKTSFMLPLPKKVSTLFMAPFRLLFKKKWPENWREIAILLLIYCVVLILISLPVIWFFPLIFY